MYICMIHSTGGGDTVMGDMQARIGQEMAGQVCLCQ